MGNSKDNKQINIAISRLNKSYVRRDVADQIIDLVIALEAMTTIQPADSLRFKVAVLIARLLEKDLEERKELAKKITEVYKTRSTIVHKGTTIKWSKKIFKSETELVFFTRELVKRSILRLIDLIFNRSKKRDLEDIIGEITYS